MKKCSFCAEEILDDAIKCKHCGSDLNSASKALPTQQEITRKILPPAILLPGEKLYYETRPYKGTSFVATVFFALISIYYHPLWIVTVLVFFINYGQWKNKIYAITNKRVITLRGLVGKSHRECPLDKIQNIECKVFWYANSFGSILFDTAGGPVKELTWIDLYSPRTIFAKISGILHR